MTYLIRKATIADQPALDVLIARSTRELSVGAYTTEQIEGGLHEMFGVDSQLIRDGTYFVVESCGQLVGCGGWGCRHTLCGGDQNGNRNDAALNPLVDAAKIRAYFIHPEHARKGIGTLILERCEIEAVAYGFSRFELMATLPGLPFYASHGYTQGMPIQYPLGAGLTIEFVPMQKVALL